MLKFNIVNIIILQSLNFLISKTTYINEWAVNINGGVETAKQIAYKLNYIYVDQIMPDYYLFRHKRLKRRSTVESVQFELLNFTLILSAKQQIAKKRVKRDIIDTLYNDPMWNKMWYMHRSDGNDMNVVNVYQKYNITGRGIRITILDDGIEKDHPDLATNYDASASYDVNDHDSDPQPRYDITNENRHGTRCAGEVSAQANNNLCNLGIAYNSRIGGVRMLDGVVTDAVEAQSISLNPNYIHIYSASWGPDDDGKTVDGPGPLARKAFFDGVNKGRKGLGNIFVWASGNGGLKGDSCSCDGYANSIYTLSISSASENGKVPWYSEACSSTLASTYSSGDRNERQILTTDLRKTCTETHTGTSASAPLAAAICALALEANPSLTWRDLQHIIVLTSRKANLLADDWVVNGIGRPVSHHFGFGLMDAEKIVEMSLNWTQVPQQHRCFAASSGPINKNIEPSQHLSFLLTTTSCLNQPDSVVFLEHVETVITLTASVRGEIELFLTSPFGTKSQLLRRRSQDQSKEGFKDWTFMTSHSWGERAAGTWVLEVYSYGSTCILNQWSLFLSGTTQQHPAYFKFNPPPTNIHVKIGGREDDSKNFVPSLITPSFSTITELTNYTETSCPPDHFFQNSCTFGVKCESSLTSQQAFSCMPCPTTCLNCQVLSPCTFCKVNCTINKHFFNMKIVIICVPIVCVIVIGGVFYFIRRRQRRTGAMVYLSYRTRSEGHVSINTLDDKPLMEDASDSDFDESMDTVELVKET